MTHQSENETGGVDPEESAKKSVDSDALLQVPPEVTVHTSSPAVDLLYALYFYLT